MDREKINKYFLNLINGIIENESEWSCEALLCKSGSHYEENDFVLETELEVISNFNIDIKHGASKLVVISNDNNEYSERYVVKIPFDYAVIDYCEEELKTYNSVLDEYENFKEYFAECWLAGLVDVKDSDGIICHVPVYIMARADVNEEEVENSGYKFWLSNGGEPDSYYPIEDEEVINCFKSYYGEKIGKAIEEVIDVLDVTDLHAGNIGFTEDGPVLIDYSGFWG